MQVSAEMVGLHGNAELVYATTQAGALYTGLQKCIGGGGGGSGGGGGDGGALTGAQAEQLQARSLLALLSLAHNAGVVRKRCAGPEPCFVLILPALEQRDKSQTCAPYVCM
jgi:hypothetical protein